MNIIEDYDLNADPSITDHDMMCIQQASKLQKIGYLEYEAAAYGCVVFSDDIYYFVSGSEESVERFVRDSLLKGLYPTSINYFVKRFDVIHGTKDEIQERFKLNVASKLKKKYPRFYLDFLKDLTITPSSNAGYSIINDMMRQLENLFDIDQLILFKDFAEILLKSRHINLETYCIAMKWLENEFEKNSDEPLEISAYRRIYAGFGYIDHDGKVKYFCDAVPYNARRKRDMLLSDGCITSPILQKSFYAENFQKLLSMRDQYITLLKSLRLENYFKIMELVKKLPASVDKTKYWGDYEQIKGRGNVAIEQEFLALGKLWNVVYSNN